MLLGLGYGDDALCAATVGHLLINLRGDRCGWDTDRSVQTVENKQFYDLIAAGDAVFDFTLSLYDEQPFFTAEG